MKQMAMNYLPEVYNKQQKTIYDNNMKQNKQKETKHITDL